jgi:hypothetical protein
MPEMIVLRAVELKAGSVIGQKHGERSDAFKNHPTVHQQPGRGLGLPGLGLGIEGMITPIAYNLCLSLSSASSGSASRLGS